MERINKEQFFQLKETEYGLRGHNWKIAKERFRLDTRKYF